MYIEDFKMEGGWELGRIKIGRRSRSKLTVEPGLLIEAYIVRGGLPLPPPPPVTRNQTPLSMEELRGHYIVLYCSAHMLSSNIYYVFTASDDTEGRSPWVCV